MKRPLGENLTNATCHNRNGVGGPPVYGWETRLW